MLDLDCSTPQFGERFWSKVDRRSPNECWPWLACIDRKGYGAFAIRRGVRRFAHRVAWALTFGPIPDTMYVCHHCDNPGCCNPAHLFLGTNTDNMRDCAGKGRLNTARHDGEHNPRARLTEDDVRLIRARVADGETRADIAREYGLTWGAIDHAARGISWPHVK